MIFLVVWTAMNPLDGGLRASYSRPTQVVAEALTGPLRRVAMHRRWWLSRDCGGWRRSGDDDVTSPLETRCSHPRRADLSSVGSVRDRNKLKTNISHLNSVLSKALKTTQKNIIKSFSLSFSCMRNVRYFDTFSMKTKIYTRLFLFITIYSRILLIYSRAVHR